MKVGHSAVKRGLVLEKAENILFQKDTAGTTEFPEIVREQRGHGIRVVAERGRLQLRLKFPQSFGNALQSGFLLRARAFCSTAFFSL